ncbi:MAG: 3,4-dihydroxy-2-butanone-4-phosphate synthase [Treponema sp.]|jgi:3,4-dihydroxy 2-butanone 4-phosphate synthase/GTP cyclohydrolase II|nr:3,4-dihydroxy-2-butanone-4-phosphate synthase [Treponema sp.]
MNKVYADVEEALEEIRRGNMLIVTDDEGRENEGDFIMAAEKAGPESVNFVIQYGRGLLCQAITEGRSWELDLPPMVQENTSAHTTAFTVSVDARQGTTTGISAFDRAATIQALVNPATRPEDLYRPGHIFPLIARGGGVLTREGHTETAVDLARIAGLTPSGILCEIVDDNGAMARLPRLEDIAHRHGIKILTVASLVRWRRQHEPDTPAVRLTESRLPTEAGGFRVILYDNPGKPDQPHLALVSDTPFARADALVRVHSECLTGEVLMSSRCDCGAQLAEAIRRIATQGGVLIYLRQEGRGIGLAEKIRAYSLQDQGLDTVEANLKLGHHGDERDYKAAAAMLRDLDISGIRLMTNNPAKVEGLAAAGINITKRVALEIKPGAENRNYLAVKKTRFGHHLELV